MNEFYEISGGVQISAEELRQAGLVPEDLLTDNELRFNGELKRVLQGAGIVPRKKDDVLNKNVPDTTVSVEDSDRFRHPYFRGH